MFVFPAHILTPATVRRFIERQTLSGGQSLSGDVDTIEADGGGRWRVDYTGIELVDARQARVWGAWAEYLAGGTVECLVPLLSFTTSPRAFFHTRPKPPSALYRDNDEWPTVMRYAAPEHSANFALAAILRDTVVSIVTAKGPEPAGGELFSYDGHAHRLIRPLGDGSYSIVPPLRADTEAGTPVAFDFPLLRVRAVPNQELGAPLFRGKQATVGISFQESI